MGNRIPRNFKWIVATALTSNNAGRAGDQFLVMKDERGYYIGTNTRTEEEFCMFVSHLRNPNYYKLEVVV